MKTHRIAQSLVRNTHRHLLPAILTLLLALASAAPAAAQSTTADVVYGQLGSFTTNCLNCGGAISADSLDEPRAVAIDSNGNLYVTDTLNGRVLFYPAGSTTASRVYGTGGSFTVSSSNSSVAGVNPDSLNGPSGVATDSNGNLYVADSGNNRVLFYPAGSTTATRVYGQLGNFGTSAGNNGNGLVSSADSLSSPNGLATDSNGNLYVADYGNRRVLFYPAGSTTATRVYGTGGSFTYPGNPTDTDRLDGPTGVAIDSNGNLYVADVQDSRVVFYPAGTTTATRVYGQLGDFTTNTANKGGVSADSLNGAFGVATDSNGNLYVADDGNSRVLFYPIGSTTATRVYGQLGSFTTNSFNNGGGVGGVSANGLAGPTSLVTASNGNLYVADNGNSRVLGFPPGPTSQTITFTGTPSTAIYNSTFTVSATASSGLLVTITPSGVCTLSGNTVTMTSGTGTCTLTASQAGNTNYSPAPNVVNTVTAQLAGQTITFTGTPSAAAYNSTFTASATASSGLLVTITPSGVCTLSGNTVTMTSGTGTCALTASQAGNTNYSVAAQVIQSVAAQKVNSTTGIVSTAPSPSVVGQPVTVSFSVTGNGTPTSNVTVTASTGETCTGSAPTGSCVVTFNTSGSRTLAAAYAGDSNFNRSNSASVTQNVGDFTISASPGSQTTSGGKSVVYTISLTSKGGLAANVSLNCSGGPPNSTCTISPSSVMLTGTASATVTLFAPMKVNKGTFTLTFTGTLGSLVHSTSVSLTVK